MMLRILIIATLFPTFAFAQTLPVASINLSGTIATTNTFQSIQAKTNNRQGCAIQNNSTTSHNMYVYFGTITNATTSNSVVLQPGQGLSCNSGSNIVVRDPVSIAGTSGDPFYANFQ